MFRKYWPYFLVFALVLVFLYKISERTSQHDVVWKENYTGDSKVPFGCYVAKDFIDDMMNGQMSDVKSTAYIRLSGDSEMTNHNYIFVNDEFSPSALDVVHLCKFVSVGNTVLISARDFGTLLSDTLGIATGDPVFVDVKHDSIHSLNAAMLASQKFVEANLVNPSLTLAQNVFFDQTRYAKVFTQFDTAGSVVLGNDGEGKANFIRVKMGRGNFLLHTLPDAFANYYAADKNTGSYLFRVLSYLPVQSTLFDEHYKVGIEMDDDPRRYILSEPALHLAYIVVIIAGLLALFFGGKRRQRPVPVVAPPSNSTLEFVEQVGALYYRQGNHPDIIAKKINYFLESVRTRFFVKTMEFDETFVTKISNLSGVPLENVKQLFVVVDGLRRSGAGSEKELKYLDQLIWDFNLRSKR